MSFIFDDNDLINKLLTSATMHLEKFGQQYYDRTTYELANKFLTQLQSSITSPISTLQNYPVDLTFKVTNLHDFVNWAASSKLTWKGKRFAWADGETDIPQNALTFGGRDPNRAKEVKNEDGTIVKTPLENQVYALKDELIEFIKYLRDSEENKNNKLLQELLSGIINDANTQLVLGDKDKISTEISEKKDDKEEDKLNPNLIIDGLPQIIDLGAKPDIRQFNSAAIKITPHMLNDLGYFRRTLLESVVVKDNKTGKQISFQENPCMIVHALYLRADNLVKVISDSYDNTYPGYSKGAKLYLDKVMELGKSMQCQVTTPNVSSGDRSQGTPARGNLSTLIKYLPLANDNIDFQRIKIFFDQFIAFETGPQQSTINQLKDQVDNIITKINSISNVPLTRIDLRANARSALGGLKPQAGNMMNFIDSLNSILSFAHQGVNTLSSLYSNNLSDYEKQAILNQSTYLTNNKSVLDQWEYAVKQFLNRGR